QLFVVSSGSRPSFWLRHCRFLSSWVLSQATGQHQHLVLFLQLCCVFSIGGLSASFLTGIEGSCGGSWAWGTFSRFLFTSLRWRCSTRFLEPRSGHGPTDNSPST